MALYRLCYYKINRHSPRHHTAAPAIHLLQFDPMARYKSPTTRPELLAAVKRHLRHLADGQETDAKELQSEWEEFYALYDPVLRRFYYSFKFTQSETDNLVQDVWIKVQNALTKEFEYQPGPGCFRAWLRTIVERTVKDALDKLKGQQRLGRSATTKTLRELIDKNAEDASEVFDREETRDQVHEVIARMREEGLSSQADLLERRYIDGQQPVDIAADLGKTPEAVRQALARARESFRRTVGRMSFRDLDPGA